MVRQAVLAFRFFARVAFAITAWALVALVFVQVFRAGAGVLVNPGDWSAHIRLGRRMSLPIMAMLLMSMVGRMPFRFPLLSLALYALYILQYVFLRWPTQGLIVIRALHPVNALVILLGATLAARDSWRLISEKSSSRLALGGVVAICALGLVAFISRSSGPLVTDGAATGRPISVAHAPEATL